ncbi:hypothetical protein Bhyg_10946 [Pseudolycoriella hygida]|uniref:Uncharacterized protein n=1 Tax=Pseudolycoriella hygida TaxID=35572 RepID=A0A9Q0MUH3_9DIPT|nr:hypothetical protein Bhyg_10946 [Pseudolycoriella hygida]
MLQLMKGFFYVYTEIVEVVLKRKICTNSKLKMLGKSEMLNKSWRMHSKVLREVEMEENTSVNDESYGNETFSSSSSTDRVLSGPPSEYDEQNRIFHLNFIRRFVKEDSPLPKKYKNGTRASLSFTNDQMREIERSNRILLTAIFRHI